MTTTPGLLVLLSDSLLRDELDRVAAAVGFVAVHPTPGSVISRKAWASAIAVVLDESSALGCATAVLPRRNAVFVVASSEPDDAPATTYKAAMRVGALRVIHLPAQAQDLVAELADTADCAQLADGRGGAIAVIGGRGGAGASSFAVALAHLATDALVVDLDPWSGGIDLLLGAETVTGLRWPDVAVKSGRLNWAAVRDALPRHRGISLLSAGRRGHDPDGGAVDAVLDAGRRGGATVVCDLPRWTSDAAVAALDAADLVVVLTPCDVRSCAASAAMAPTLIARNPNVGLVVRGPSPGGLHAAEVSDMVSLPLLAAMRPEPLLAEKVDAGGLRLRRRSPLAAAAGEVLAALEQRTGRRGPAVERTA